MLIYLFLMVTMLMDGIILIPQTHHIIIIKLMELICLTVLSLVEQPELVVLLRNKFGM